MRRAPWPGIIVRMARLLRTRHALLFAAVSAAGCNQILGLGDFTEDTNEGSGGAGGASSSSSSSRPSSSSSTHASSSRDASSQSSSSTSAPAGSTSGTGGAGGAMMACPPDAMRSCYDGPTGTDTQGLCTDGTQTCAEDGSAWGMCVGEVVPAVEDCTNPADENCDGLDCIEWSKLHGDQTDAGASAVTVDASGNVYLGGFFTGSVTIGNLPALISSGQNDVFLVKYAPDGTPIWAERFGQAGAQYATGLGVDANGDLLMSGIYAGTITLGPNTFMAAAGDSRGFVAKLSPADGSVAWSVDFETGSSNNVFLAVDPRPIASGGGDVAVLGTLVTGTDINVFLRRYTTGGALTVNKTYGNASTQVGESIAMDAGGNMLISGEFAGSINFGDGSHTSAGGLDGFVAKLDSAGVAAWSLTFGDANDQYANAVGVSPTGEVYVGGAFYGTVNLGGGTLTSGGDADIFVAKLSAGGSHVWSLNVGDASLQSLRSLAVDKDGDVAITGWNEGAMAFVNGPTLTTSGDDDLFVAKLDRAGATLWARGYGDANKQLGQTITTTPLDEVVVAGWSKGTIDFGDGAHMAPGSGYNAFIAKLGK
jgi:hypothetical protein